MLIKSNFYGGANQRRADLNWKALLHKGHAWNLQRHWGLGPILDLWLRHALLRGLAPDFWLAAALTPEFRDKRHRQHGFLFFFLGNDDLVTHLSSDNKGGLRTPQQNPSLRRKDTLRQLILFHYPRERRHLH